MNGVIYYATVFVRTNQSFTVSQLHDMFGGTRTEWNSDDGQKGRNGVFDAEFELGQTSPGIVVSSPCYFLRDVDGVSTEDKQKVTGFSSRKWDE